MVNMMHMPGTGTIHGMDARSVRRRGLAWSCITYRLASGHFCGGMSRRVGFEMDELVGEEVKNTEIVLVIIACR